VFQGIRAHPFLRDSTVLFVFENNLGREQDHLTRLVESSPLFSNSYPLHENDKLNGFHTYAYTKLRADDLLYDRVSMGALSFAEDMICVNPKYARNGGEAMKELMIHQMSEMKEYVRRNPNGTSTRVITSIHGDDKKHIKGKHDDVQRAFSNYLIAEMRFRNRDLPLDYDHIYSLRASRKFLEHDSHYLMDHVAREAKRVKFNDDGDY
jgi:hypothetical protein